MRLSVKPKKLIEYSILLLISTVFLLIFSLWTTPLYPSWYGCDASFFTMAGRGIVNGWIPYVDFFDLKGPYFFFIEALSQLIVRGRTGAFIMQVIALFFTLVLMIKTCRMFISRKKTAFIIALFLLLHIATLWGGNTLEEYMLPVNLLSIYLIIRDLKEEGDIHWLTALICGISFSIILFSKVTVASPIIGLVLAVIIYFVKKKRYINLITFLIYAFLGVLLGITPLFIYFFVNNALSDMLYSVFIFAFKRSIDFDQKYNLRWELKISGCYFAFVFALVNMVDFTYAAKKVKQFVLRSRTVDANDIGAEANDISTATNDISATINGISTATNDISATINGIGTATNDISTTINGIGTAETDFQYDNPAKCEVLHFLLISILFIAFITAVSLHFGDPFIYYFTTVYPVIMLTFIAVFMIYDPFTLFTNWRLDIPLIMFAVTLCYFASHTASTLNTVIYDRKNDTFQDDYQKCALEMASLIPENERNNVYSFNMDMQWFEINNILPCYTYTINLQFFIALDSRIETDIINKLNTDPPKWIVVGGNLSDYLPNINEIVITKYDFIYQNPYGSLYILK